MNVNAKQSFLVPLTPENKAMVWDIAQIFPIRLRYYRWDRFGNLMPTTSVNAELFRVTCRYAETWQDLADLDPEDLIGSQPVPAPTGKMFKIGASK